MPETWENLKTYNLKFFFENFPSFLEFLELPETWENLKPNKFWKIFFEKGLEILIAVVFCKECVLPVQWWFLFCKGGEDGRGTDGGGGRTKTRIARPKHIIKSCVKMHMNSNIHNEFPAPLKKNETLTLIISNNFCSKFIFFHFE